MKYPIIDLHCDLLSYLARVPKAHVNNTEEIGAALPYLKAGNVKHQILAIFTITQKGSVAFAQQQVEEYQKLIATPDFYAITDKKTALNIKTSDQVGLTVALESASGICEEDEKLDLAFERLDKILDAVGHLFYISFTHHTENRFGGGNYSNNVGLRRDGELLLEYMDGKKIAADLAHTSDNLAYGIINYIDKKGLDIPVIASHSNFRPLCDHVRNLPDELTQEVIQRKGLIGMNFLRDYVHSTDPKHLIEHILYGLQADVAKDYLAFGADFFYRKVKIPVERQPLFFAEHEDAGKYPFILENLEKEGATTEILEQLAYQNVLDYIERYW